MYDDDRDLTAPEILVEQLSDLGINALTADDTIVLVELGPRGPDIFRELSRDTADAGGPSQCVGWLLVEVQLADEVEAIVARFTALLPRFPELRKNLQ